MRQYNINELKDLFESLNSKIDNHKNKNDIRNGKLILTMLKRIQQILIRKENLFNNSTSEALRIQLTKEMFFMNKNLDPVVEKTFKLQKKGLIL